MGEMELMEGATRYARPWRPVKPLLMIWELRARSEAQRAQRRWEAWPFRKESVSGGLVPVELSSMEFVRAEEALLSVLDFRRNGSDGTR